MTQLYLFAYQKTNQQKKPSLNDVIWLHILMYYSLKCYFNGFFSLYSKAQYAHGCFTDILLFFLLGATEYPARDQSQFY